MSKVCIVPLMAESELGAIRIGELSRRVGVSEHALRAWESRYQLLHPTRSAGGYRLYSAADEHRVRRMTELIAGGLSAAEAAGAVRTTPPTSTVDSAGVPEDRESLRQALDGFDEPAAQAVLDRLLSRLTVPTVLREVVLPYLHGLGERWQRGTVSVAQEHFASNVLRGRLAGLALGWGAGTGPRAVLACPPGELHDLPLMVFGITLNRVGWRVTYLGSDTPPAELLEAVDIAHPELVVLAAVAANRFEDVADELAELAGRHTLALAGAGASPALAARTGARLLSGDPVSEAETVAQLR